MQGERKKTAKKAAREECRNKKTEGKKGTVCGKVSGSYCD
jgi:hypothetical protein